MHLGIFLPNWVGDAVMATPALRALRRRFGPHARLVGVMRPAVAETLAGTSWLDQQLIFDPRPRKGTQRPLSTWQLIRALRAQQLDTVLLLTNSFRTALLARASRMYS